MCFSSIEDITQHILLNITTRSRTLDHKHDFMFRQTHQSDADHDDSNRIQIMMMPIKC